MYAFRKNNIHEVQVPAGMEKLDHRAFEENTVVKEA